MGEDLEATAAQLVSLTHASLFIKTKQMGAESLNTFTLQF